MLDDTKFDETDLELAMNFENFIFKKDSYMISKANKIQSNRLLTKSHSSFDNNKMIVLCKDKQRAYVETIKTLKLKYYNENKD